MTKKKETDKIIVNKSVRATWTVEFGDHSWEINTHGAASGSPDVNIYLPCGESFVLNRVQWQAIRSGLTLAFLAIPKPEHVKFGDYSVSEKNAIKVFCGDGVDLMIVPCERPSPGRKEVLVYNGEKEDVVDYLVLDQEEYEALAKCIDEFFGTPENTPKRRR